MAKSINIQQFNLLNSQVDSIKNQLYLYGITHISNFGIKFKYEDNSSVMKKISKLEFYELLNLKEKVALSLADTQESANDYLDDADINFINDFFGYDIDHDLINSIGNRFI